MSYTVFFRWRVASPCAGALAYGESAGAGSQTKAR
jgi:hypothetical protein